VPQQSLAYLRDTVGMLAVEAASQASANNAALAEVCAAKRRVAELKGKN
jgi:hypothetical protein